MNALVRKEIRLLLPAWIASVVLVLAAGWFTTSVGKSSETPAWLVGVAMALLGLTSFGREFTAGTFSLLLSQPVSRSRVWTIKIILLAAAALPLLCLWLAYWLSRSFQWDDTMAFIAAGHAQFLRPFVMDGLIALAFLTGGLWTTLLLRQIAAAFWISLLIPVAILIAISSSLETLLVLGGYSVAGIGASLWLFVRAQDAQWTGGMVVLPQWRRRQDGGVDGRRTGRPLAALLGKELQLQQTNFIMAAAVLALHVGFIFVRLARHDLFSDAGRIVAESFWMLWLVLPVLMGCAAVAEERKFGTLEGMLCQPVGYRTQYAVKLAVVLILSYVFGLLAPFLLEQQAVHLGLKTSTLLLADRKQMWLLALLLSGGTTVAFYSSTLTRNLLQSIGLAIILLTIMPVVLGLTANSNAAVYEIWSPELYLMIAGPLLWLALVLAGLWNYRRLGSGWSGWKRNLATFAGTLLLAGTTTAAIYHRVWERFETLEPAHGMARLAGTVRPKIVFSFEEFFVLLPDGRLWTNAVSWPTGSLHMGAGGFAGTNTWVDVAVAFDVAAGIQTDGSLWRLVWIAHATNGSLLDTRAERIGSDADWKIVAAGNSKFLAVKEDGTLWQGRYKKGGGIEFSQLGHDSDWLSVFADDNVITAIKRDGSMWKWGSIYRGPDWSPFHTQSHGIPTPVQWRMEGTNTIAVVGDNYHDICIRSDGSLWGAGHLSANFWGNGAPYKVQVQPIQIGKGGAWRDMTFDWGNIVALDSKGVLWAQHIYNMWEKRDAQPRAISTHDDWVAIGTDGYGGIAALAADGTLTYWGAYGTSNPRNLLGPTQRPQWSFNILEAENHRQQP